MAEGLCVVEECPRRAVARGMCRKHYQRDWAARHPERRRAQGRRYRGLHSQEIHQRDREYHERNRDRINVRTAQWRRDHPEYVSTESARAWRENNPELARRANADHQARRRAALRGAVINDFTDRDWVDLLVEFEDRCAYCGSVGPLERDHVVPLLMGGAHTKANIVPACVPCNRSKGMRPVEEFMACG